MSNVLNIREINLIKSFRELKDWQFILLNSIIFSFLPNLAFWRNVLILQEGSWIQSSYFYLAMMIFVVCVLNVFFSLIFWRTTKIIIILLLLVSTLFGYFSFNFNIYIDVHMLINIIETNTGEAITLLTSDLVLWLLAIFLLPSIFIWKARIKQSSISQSVKIRIVMILMSIIFLLATSLPIYNYYASFFRNNNQVIKQLTPSNYIVAGTKLISMAFIKPLPFRHIAQDAEQRFTSKTSNIKPRLMILVVGETSRAQNFSLNGYTKKTNPRLGKRNDVINFIDAHSCGTATAISVPCMFSNLTRESYNHEIAISQDNILDILQRAGVSILWRENDEGCKGVCNRILTQQVIDFTPKNLCPSGLCYDENQLVGLSEFIDAQKRDTLIILHTNGSHGPAYYQRYPESLSGKFQPTCETNQIQSCDKTSLINTYDNTILYIDYVLDKIIHLLEEKTTFATAMLYLSDHGESLGERALYLHAAPYMIAPKEQTHIPFLMWFSQRWLSDNNLTLDCLKDTALTKKVSHDNLFHTLLGVFDVATTEYNQELDILASCYSHT